MDKDNYAYLYLSTGIWIIGKRTNHTPTLSKVRVLSPQIKDGKVNIALIPFDIINPDGDINFYEMDCAVATPSEDLIRAYEENITGIELPR